MTHKPKFVGCGYQGVNMNDELHTLAARLTAPTHSHTHRHTHTHAQKNSTE